MASRTPLLPRFFRSCVSFVGGRPTTSKPGREFYTSCSPESCSYVFPCTSPRSPFLDYSTYRAQSRALPPSSCFARGILSQQIRAFASKKHKWVLRRSKGFRGRANRCFRIAIRRLEKSWQYAYRDRKNKKREFRKLWIQRLNAGVRQYGISYSRFIQAQGRSGVILDRKILSSLAMYEPFSFKAILDVVHMMSASKQRDG